MIWWTIQQLKSKSTATRVSAVERIALEAGDEVVPTLIEAARDPAKEVRIAAVTALGRRPEARPSSFLAKVSSDRHYEVRCAVAMALGQLGDAVSFGTLVSLLLDSKSAVRWQSAKSLSKLRWTPSNAREMASLMVASGEFKDAARLGAAAIEPLKAVINDEDSQVRRHAIDALTIIADTRVVQVLISALRDEDSGVRVAVVEALAQFPDTRVLAPLTQALRDPASHVRASAANVLGKLGDPSCVLRLVGALKDSSWDVRKAVVEALGRLKDPRAVDGLSEALKDADNDVREAAVESLSQIADPRCVERLILALCDGESSVRQASASALMRVDRNWQGSEAAQRTLPELRAALKSRDYWVRQSASEVLTKISKTQSVPRHLSAGLGGACQFRNDVAMQIFSEALRDGDRDLRQAAVEALGRIGDQRACEPLSSLLQDSDETVRDSTRTALLALGWQPPDNVIMLGPRRADTWAKAM